MNLVIVAILCILAYIFCFHWWTILTNNYEIFRNIHKHCFVKIDRSEKNTAGKIANALSKLRGDNYYLGDNEKDFRDQIKSEKYCVFTSWHLSHILFHFVMGYLTKKIYPSVLIGVGFEILEYRKFNCHDILDVFYNILGAYLGASF